jgi:hypothetical protein
MIKVNRPTNAPAILKKKGETETENNQALYNEDSAAYISGKLKFTIDPKIYGSLTIKAALKKAQNNKCCFCEKNQVEEYGAVEHFRPKGGYKKDRKEKSLTKPGYYWLGYTWENLLFVCSFCNTTYKGNLFPLVNESKRVRSHHGDVSLEDPYLIDPTIIDPRDHIYFDNELVRWKTEYGKQTISICGLDRESLNDERRELIENIKSRIVTVVNEKHMNPADVKEAKTFLRNAVSPSAPYSATAIDYLKQFNIQ